MIARMRTTIGSAEGNMLDLRIPESVRCFLGLCERETEIHRILETTDPDSTEARSARKELVELRRMIDAFPRD